MSKMLSGSSVEGTPSSATPSEEIPRLSNSRKREPKACVSTMPATGVGKRHPAYSKLVFDLMTHLECCVLSKSPYASIAISREN